VSARRLRRAIVAQTGRARLYPVFFGSAITGAGVDELLLGIRELLPKAPDDVEGPVSGTVFKMERGAAGEPIAYVRMYSGTLRLRDRIRFGEDDKKGRVTAIAVYERGRTFVRSEVVAGGIAKVWGLTGRTHRRYVGGTERAAAWPTTSPRRRSRPSSSRVPNGIDLCFTLPSHCWPSRTR
jgi:ribosomal protection tetracycline resistance protein